ncbi:Ig-like domain-containing protein [Butyricicoccus sp. OF27-2pH9A]|uniref:Ig-like domain-containing protein n=1 Tax=Butyricicoccus sp. OF27-2pH9A TaxID=3002517 RepID=UPI0022DF1101|nr:Ig-like domain-containing protein [Butyricicoccus sp. OF27-2pH9A]
MQAADTISDTATNTYRADSLMPSYKTENGYTVLTYTPTAEGETELKIYELNGAYYSKNESTYTSLSLVTGLYQNTDGKLFKPGAAATTQITVSGSKKQVTGDTVTLTAAVSVEDSGAANNGTVTFEITNTTTGSVVRYPVSKSSGNSKVECKWTPSEAGVYNIVAIFGGNSETNGSRSGAVTYYAKAADDLYEISVSDCTYGDTISPSLKSVTINGTTSPEKTGVTYTAYKDGSSAVTNWESGKTLVPGTYRITAAAEGKVLASKYITVSKKPITVTAPDTRDGTIKFENFVNDDNYANLFKTEGMPTDNTAGVYNVSVVYNEPENGNKTDFVKKQEEFLSKYTPTLKNSMVVVQADTYKVTYSNGNNGTLQGYQGDYSTSFNSGANIASGSNVIFAATPAENYQVWKWTVKSDGQELTKGSDYTLSDDNKTLTVSSLQKNLDVHVEFSNQFYTVSAQSGENGSVAAAVNGNPLAATSVLSGTEVTFTAAPKKDYVVKQWTVTRDNGTPEIQKNTDGTVFSGKELKLTITANTEVNVTFEQTAQFTVYYSAVEQENTNKSVALNFETTGLTDGKGEKGSAVTLTAKPSSAMGIAGWQYKTSESGTWINSSVTGLRYTIRNLQSNIWVRALVNDNATPTVVNFGVVDESGNTVADGGTLTAKYTANGTEITDGAECTTYSKITFTYTEPTTYEVVKWQVNKADVTAVRNGKTFTYTIDSLTTPTTVNMVVRAKPIVTVTPPKNGTISVAYTLNGKTVEPEEGKYVYSGTKAIVTAAPNDNYVATDVKADSGSSIITTPNTDKVNGVQTLTVAEIKANTTFSATFVEKPVVTIKAGENSSVEVKGTVNGKADTALTSGTHVDFGTDLIVTATPESGYVVGTINGSAVNEDKANGAKDKTLEKVGENTEITATFLAKPRVTISTVAGGTVEVKGTVDGTPETVLATNNYVDFGTSLTVTLTPDKGYEVGTMNGVTPAYTDGTGNTTDNKSYAISNVQNDQTITPVWSAIPTTTVNWSVIDKTPDTNGGTDGTLKATVTRKGMGAYAVTDSKDGTLTVYRDSVVTFTAEPNTGYKTGVWQLNGKQQDSQPELTITNDIVNTTQKVEVQFEPLGNQVTYGFKEGSAAADKHNATLSAAFTPNSGTATNFASGTTPTTDGSITFTVSGLDNGYEVEGWYVDGSKQSGETDTTFTHKVTHNVGMDVQVKIVRKSYTVNFSAMNGTVTATAGGTTLANGDSVVGDTSVTFTAMPQSATGYTFDGWTVNGEKSVETSETLTLPITKDTTVSAAYTLNTVSYAVNYGVISDSDDTANGTLTAKNGTKTFDSGAEQPAGSTIVFTAQPEDGYQVKGWYTAADGTTEIADTASEQNRYTITNLTDEATVYVAFEPIPTYDITISTTGFGHVTAAVNGTETEITDGKLTVSRHANVVLTAVPDEKQYLTGWTLDTETKGNSSLSLTLDDVTDGHTVKADFAASQLVTLKTICRANGTLTAQAGHGDTIETVDASSESGIQVEKDKKVVLRVTPKTDYMVKMWTVNGTVQNNLSNTLTIENLSENTEVEVAFEPLVLHSVPQSGMGYTVTVVEKIPNDYGNENQIRERGTVTFTVSPESGKYLMALKVNNKDCLAAISNNGNENKLRS